VTHPNVPPEVAKRADQLVVGDRIAAKRLPFASDLGEVLLVRLHDYRGADWVFVAWMQPDGYHDSTSFLPDATIEVVPAADPSGHGFSREADDPTPASGGRIEPHTGGMTNRGLVDESEPGPTCSGSNGWVQADCGRGDAHGAH
jgi:hypothetical protein